MYLVKNIFYFLNLVARYMRKVYQLMVLKSRHESGKNHSLLFYTLGI